MKAYCIVYVLNGEQHETYVDAKDLASAKKKIGRKHGYKSGRMIKVIKVDVLGYF